MRQKHDEILQKNRICQTIKSNPNITDRIAFLFASLFVCGAVFGRPAGSVAVSLAAPRKTRSVGP